jgi:hypothetical protein
MADKAEFLLNLSSAKIEKLEKALERNWIVHLVLAGVGLALVFDIGDLPKVVAKYFSQEQYSIKPAALIILPVLLYYFMKFGHLLGSFIVARRLHDSMFGAYIDKQSDGSNLSPLRETTSFFEVFYSVGSFGGRGPLVFAYFVVTPAVISLTQASALFLVVKAYGINVWSMSTLILSAIAFLILYWGFWKSHKDHPGTTKIAIGCLALVVGWLILFGTVA